MSRCTVMCQQRQHEEDNQEHGSKLLSIIFIKCIQNQLVFMNKEMHLRCNCRHNPFWVSNTKYRTETGNLHIAHLRWKQTTACICVNTVIPLQLVDSKDWSCRSVSVTLGWRFTGWRMTCSEPWWDVSDLLLDCSAGPLGVAVDIENLSVEEADLLLEYTWGKLHVDMHKTLLCLDTGGRGKASCAAGRRY